MWETLGSVMVRAGQSVWIAAQILLLSAIFFVGLAVLLKGDDAFAAARRAARESRINLTLAFLDALMVAPVVGLLVQLVRAAVDWSRLALLSPEQWTPLGTAVTAFAVVFVGDFVSYWRHRMEHTRLLWPAHAIHHSDTEMTWLTLQRFHPINRATTSIVDVLGLALLGFPDWALVLNVMVRHYYGEFIHADFPWTYGPLGRMFVSPVMHRWHHARDVVGSGSNFATVFSVFDQAFGTYHVPGLCTVPLGVNDEMGRGTIGQLFYPFVAWTDRLRGLWKHPGNARELPLDGSRVSGSSNVSGTRPTL